MQGDWNRRDFLRLAGIGGVAVVGDLFGCAGATTASSARAPKSATDGRANAAAGGDGQRNGALAGEFFFLQLTDTHWGYKGASNPQADTTLEHAVATINGTDAAPDFVVFTGDLTHMTDDAAERRARMARFREIASGLKVKDVRYIPGEHDAASDGGEAFRDAFGPTHWSFEHKGVHFVALDNVSAKGGGAVGAEQIDWLSKELSAVPPGVPVIVFAHRPLFDLYPDWDWTTKDGAAVNEILAARPEVTVFYGHIHQALSKTIGKVTHHSARSLVFPLPAPGTEPKKAPLAWDPQATDHGLGWRQIALGGAAPMSSEIVLR